MTNDQRRKIIKAKLAMSGIQQTEIARTLGISAISINLWVKGELTSINIENWFKEKFGEKFITELKKVA